MAINETWLREGEIDRAPVIPGYRLRHTPRPPALVKLYRDFTNQRPMQILDRKWRWIGHSLRQEDSRLTKQALVFAPQGKRRIGRPRISWIRTLAQEIKSINMSWPEVVAAASDRQKGKSVVRPYAPLGVQGLKKKKKKLYSV
ncbi:uncharacterized protein LOC125490638 [Plutella xylostella]|uniref:uncharacterized protein LOC125490638 n=1 Tax=Plutella xylostella TaxID=51655 RepID=UPI002032FAD2|nr:uncharacterized protein LOC125490638 [Plutella xylostella]